MQCDNVILDNDHDDAAEGLPDYTQSGRLFGVNLFAMRAACYNMQQDYWHRYVSDAAAGGGGVVRSKSVRGRMRSKNVARSQAMP